ncbi:MAG: GvpL/GvpF family gas vesicle protein [Polyangia bacterium]
MAEGGARPLLCCVIAASSRSLLDEATLPEGPFGERNAQVEAASLIAVVTPLRGSAGVAQVERPRVADLVAYGRLIEHVHDRCTTLPIRFGCLFEDTAAVAQHLVDRAADYGRLLTELQGAVEVAVRMPVRPADPTDDPKTDAAGAGAGAAYLRALRARLVKEQQREAHTVREAEWLRAALADGTRAQAVSLKPLAPAGKANEPAAPAVSVSLLIERGQLAALRQRVAELAAHSGRTLTLHGPFPPYSFVKL